MELTKEYFDKVLRESFSELKSEFKSDIATLRAEMATKSEVAGLRMDIQELSEKVSVIDKRTMEDSKVFSSILLDHGRRIIKLEKITKNLHTS